MKLKYNFVLSKVGGKYCAVAVGDDADKYSGMIKMNNTSAFIFNMLMNGTTQEDIIEALQKKYDADSNLLYEQTVLFIDKLTEEDLLLL